MGITISLRTLMIILIAVTAAVGTWLLLDWLIVTDSERIEDLVTKTIDAADRRDVDLIVDECLAPDFKLGELDREGTRRWAKGAIKSYEVASVRKYGVETKVTGDSAQATVRTFVKTGLVPVDQRVDWELTLSRHEGNRWLIEGVRIFYFLGQERHELELANLYSNTAP